MDQAIVRHMANKIDYVYTAFPINTSIDYEEWYVMRLILHHGVVNRSIKAERSQKRGDQGGQVHKTIKN